ncbi:hypothetical protein [Acinetobacter soli]|uniref:hypothetical protein n=1 Tax=Acinetobacter soli TaxID=487316 RepID=UPI00124E7770|nr:hypothetical protein [Acinetobacter soli]
MNNEESSQITKIYIPEYVPPPQLQISHPDETTLADKWTGGFYFGAVIGFCIAMVLMQILMKS